MSKTNKTTKPTQATAEEQSPAWLYWVGLAAIVIAAIAVYEPAMGGPFVFDDLYLVPLVPGFVEKPLSDWLVGTRPMTNFSYWLSTQLSGVVPGPFHWASLLLHLANSWMVWQIAKRFLTANWAAAGAALLFLFHPLQTESVSYVASRSEVLSSLFFLAAWLLFVRKRGEGIGWLESAAVLLLFGCAALAKEHVVVLPVVLLLSEMRMQMIGPVAAIKRNWKLFAPLALATVAAVGYVLNILRYAQTAGFGMNGLNPASYFFSQCRVLWMYLRLYVLPVGLNVDYDIQASPPTGDVASWLGGLGLLVLLGVAWRWRASFGTATLGLVLFFVLLAPTSSFVPIQDLIAERRMYLAVFALSLVVMDLLGHWKTTPLMRGAAIGLACLVLAGQGYARNQAWSSAIALWESAVAESPQKVRPNFQLGFAKYQAGLCEESLPHFANAGKLAPADFRLNLDWALAADCAGQGTLALQKIEAAIAQEKSGQSLATKGMILAKQDKFDEALAALQEAEAADPSFAMTYYYRGNVQQAQERYDEALASFTKAGQVNPGWVDAQVAANNVRIQMRRREDAGQKKPAEQKKP